MKKEITGKKGIHPYGSGSHVVVMHILRPGQTNKYVTTSTEHLNATCMYLLSFLCILYFCEYHEYET